jgi:hypothetical protein
MARCIDVAGCAAVKLENTLFRTLMTGPLVAPLSKQVEELFNEASSIRTLLKSTSISLVPDPPPAD